MVRLVPFIFLLALSCGESGQGESDATAGPAAVEATRGEASSLPQNNKPLRKTASDQDVALSSESDSDNDICPSSYIYVIPSNGADGKSSTDPKVCAKDTSFRLQSGCGALHRVAVKDECAPGEEEVVLVEETEVGASRAIFAFGQN